MTDEQAKSVARSAAPGLGLASWIRCRVALDPPNQEETDHG